MLSIKIDFKKLKTWLTKQPRLIDNAVEKALIKVAKQIQTDTFPKVPNDTSELVNSWRTENQGKLTLLAGYNIIYAMYQHQGRRADGTHIIRNRPAGGQTFFLKKTIDTNLQKYFDLFERTVFKLLNY